MIVDAANKLWSEAAQKDRTASLLVIFRDFLDWKIKDPAGQQADDKFGSDGPYSRPRVDDDLELWHIHMKPPRGHLALDRWMRLLRNGEDKSSDIHLVYARQNDAYLAIHLFSRDAHLVAKMRTPEHERTMQGFAQIASEWRRDRTTYASWTEILNV